MPISFKSARRRGEDEARTKECLLIEPHIGGGASLYLCRNVIRPLERSYGVISTLTLSPTKTRMRFLRILPEVWVRTSWPFSSFTRNIALGKSSVTVPSNSSNSSLAIVSGSGFGVQGSGNLSIRKRD